MARTLNKLNQQQVYLLGKFLGEKKDEIEKQRLSQKKVATFASNHLPFKVTQRNVQGLCKSMGEDAPKMVRGVPARRGGISDSAVSAGLSRLRKAVRYIADSLKDLNADIPEGVRAILAGEKAEETPAE